jgi:hypothetical protein
MAFGAIARLAHRDQLSLAFLIEPDNVDIRRRRDVLARSQFSRRAEQVEEIADFLPTAIRETSAHESGGQRREPISLGSVLRLVAIEIRSSIRPPDGTMLA